MKRRMIKFKTKNLINDVKDSTFHDIHFSTRCKMFGRMSKMFWRQRLSILQCLRWVSTQVGTMRKTRHSKLRFNKWLLFVFKMWIRLLLGLHSQLVFRVIVRSNRFKLWSLWISRILLCLLTRLLFEKWRVL